ncbi:MAG: protein translocase subunit SecF, partial [Pseudomonadota bacterium]
MLRLKLLPDHTKIDFIRWRMIAFIGSAVAIVLSAIVFFTAGLNFGIDFRGGVTIEVETPEPADL